MNKGYEVPLDIGYLLRKEEDVRSFLNFFAKHYINTCEQMKIEDDEYLFPMVLNESFDLYNLEYNYLVSVFSEWIGGHDGELFRRDFINKVGNKDVVNQKYLIVGLLENFWGIARVNLYYVNAKRAGNIPMNLNFYRNIIYTNGDKSVQYDATAFSRSVMSNFMDENLFHEMNELAGDSSIFQSEFGGHKCRNWWSKNNKKRVVYGDF